MYVISLTHIDAQCMKAAQLNIRHFQILHLGSLHMNQIKSNNRYVKSNFDNR
jgi:hypothetical protein